MNREDILMRAKRIPNTPINLPELGEGVFVKKLLAKEWPALQSAIDAVEVVGEMAGAAHIVAVTLCDEHGELIFTSPDHVASVLSASSAAEAMRAALDNNKVGKPEDTLKNSEPSPSAT